MFDVLYSISALIRKKASPKNYACTNFVTHMMIRTFIFVLVISKIYSPLIVLILSVIIVFLRVVREEIAPCDFSSILVWYFTLRFRNNHSFDVAFKMAIGRSKNKGYINYSSDLERQNLVWQSYIISTDFIGQIWIFSVDWVTVSWPLSFSIRIRTAFWI